MNFKRILSALVLTLSILAGNTGKAAEVLPSGLPNPCAPTREMHPMILSCTNDKAYYSIEISVKGSELSCPYELRKTFYNAKISVHDLSNKHLGTLEVFDGGFAFKLGFSGTESPGYFHSPAFLDLDNCTSPQNGGGFSVTN